MKKFKKYHIITIGCQMNKADSERIAGYLESLGYKNTTDRKVADLVLVVSCGVRQSAEDRIYGLIPRIKKDNPKTKIMFTGCLVYREDIKKKLDKYVDFWLPINEITNYKLKIKNSTTIKDYLCLPPKYTSKYSAFVPIGNGCNNFCAYCVVPYARGREIYRPAKEIISEVRKLVKNGYKEIILIAQNVNSYNSQIPNPKSQFLKKFQITNKIKNKAVINFALLLRIINDIPGDFWIRFATSHPKDMSGDLIKAMAECNKVCEHLHLPAQAGDNGILKAMNRNYTIEHYKNLIKKSRRAVPDIAITTDIIVGFPGETKKQFNNTVKLFKELNFDMAYIARYSPRPGTAAAKFKDNVAAIEKKRREEELMKILRQTALRNNRKYLNKTVLVFVNEKNNQDEHIGLTRTNKNVKFRIEKSKNLIGKFVPVRINKVRDFGSEGEITK